MRVRLTEHAELRMAALGITREEIEALIDEGLPRIGETAVEYDVQWRGLRIRIVHVREPEPVRLITVHEIYAERG